MPSVWQLLESLPGPAAVPAVWKASLGAAFDAFREAYLRQLPTAAKSYPCPRECGCAHAIVRHKGGPIVAVCRCEPSHCADIRLTDADIAVLELNWQKLGRAIAKAFGFNWRQTEIGVPHAIQIAAYGDEAIPVVLSIQMGRDEFRQAAATLAAHLRGRFILIAPTADFMDAPSRQTLANLSAGFFSLDTTVVLGARATLQPAAPPAELLSAFAGERKEPLPMDVAMKAFQIVEKLDSERPMKAPTLLTVFRLYCMKGMTTNEIARKIGCAKGTVINRLDMLRERIGDPKALLRYSPQFNKIEQDISESKGSYVHRKALIADDAGRDGDR